MKFDRHNQFLIQIFIVIIYLLYITGALPFNYKDDWHYMFSNWIIIWYIFYIIGIIPFNPFMAICFGIIFNFLQGLVYIYNGTCKEAIIYFAIIITITKIFILSTLDRSFDIQSFIFGICLFIIYNIWLEWNGTNVYRVYYEITEKISKCDVKFGKI